ncbi:MAG: 50S ribosomal protein L18 [Candidatus Bipolaricaulota bacterium]
MARLTNRAAEREKRHRRIRKHVVGSSVRPRLCVTKTLHHLYAQVIDDGAGRTLAQASTLDPEVRSDVKGPNRVAAAKVAAKLAERAAKAGVVAVVFDRGGYPYHGVISAFAEACREGGLDF